MNKITSTLILSALLVSVRIADAAVVTLTAAVTNGTNGFAELSISPYEVAEVLSFPTFLNTDAALDVHKDGRVYEMRANTFDSKIPKYLDPLIVAGPAVIRLTAFNSPGKPAFCTIKVTPEAYPPDRSILVPPGTNQVFLTLQCSTNLVHWFPATNGVYGPLPEAKFFRIKLEPLP